MAPPSLPFTRRPHYRRRLLVIAVIAALLGIGLVTRLIWLQIYEAPRYAFLAQGNRIRLIPIAPTRGLILDRNGRVLAENVPTYELTLTPDQVKDLKQTLERLQPIVHLSAQDIDDFHRLEKTKQPFQAIPLKVDLTARDLARFAVNRQNFPGIDIHATLKRFYPPGTAAAEVVGYVGLINPADLKRLNPAQYSASSHVGATGIEWEYEKLLHGRVGYRKVEVNAEGRTVRVLQTQPPIPGENLYLTIDDRLQKIASRALGRYPGAMVAIQPGTGAVLGLVTSPSYNPNLFVNGISATAYQRLITDPDHPLVNRAIHGQYAPGSTIKPFLGIAALEDGVLTPQTKFYAGATFKLPNNSHVWRDWNPYQNGEVTLKQGIIQSIDTFFYQLAQRMGIERMHTALARFGFGLSPEIDLPGERDGVNPSPRWKMQIFGKPWYEGDTINSGIGQGYTLVTPLQLADATATLAVQGRRYRPHVLAATINPQTGRRSPYRPIALPPIQLHSQSYWNYIIQAMREVIESPYGTGHLLARGLDFSMAGKTGTAQVTSTYRNDFADNSHFPFKLRNNALFIAFAPVNHPEIAVAVIVEHGGSGGRAAAPIARDIISAWLQRHSLVEKHVSHPH